MKKSKKFFILLALSSFMLTKTSKAMTNVQEIWAKIPSLGNHYEVSNLGNIRSLDRQVIDFGGAHKSRRVRNLKGRQIKTGRNRDGYVLFYPTVNGVKITGILHRMVAIMHVPNPNNLPEVNHEDGDKENNAADNLKWCTRGQNMQHAHDSGLVKIPSRGDSNCAKPVYQMSLDGFLIEEYACLKDAQDATGIGFRQISAVCLGHRKTTGGYRWSY